MGKGSLLLSYTAAAILGWGAASALNKQDQQPNPNNQSSSPTTTKANTPLDGDTLIDTVLESLQPAKDKIDSTPSDAHLATYYKLKSELQPTANPANTFQELFAPFADTDPSTLDPNDPKVATLAVRYYQWLSADPNQALILVGESNAISNGITAMFLAAMGKDFAEEHGTSILFDKDNPLPANTPGLFLSALTKDITEPGNLSALLEFKSSNPELFGAGGHLNIGQQVGKNWPLDQAATVLPHLDGAIASQAAVEFAKRMDGPDGYKWILEQLDNGTLDDKAKRHLSQRHIANSFLDREGISVQERVDTYKTLGIMGNSSDHFVGAMIIDWELRQFMHNDDDWLYAFRHGEATAQEVADAAMEFMPDFDARRGEVLSQLFRQMAEDNPEEALTLKAGQSNEDITWARTNSARWAFFGVNPNDVFEWTHNTPVLNDHAQTEAFAQGWNGRSGWNLSRYGENYLQWAAQLPAGTQKKFALEGIVRSSRDRYPHIHKEARQLLEDAE